MAGAPIATTPYMNGRTVNRRGSGPGPWRRSDLARHNMVRRPGGGEGQAERLELPDVVADLL